MFNRKSIRFKPNNEQLLSVRIAPHQAERPWRKGINISHKNHNIWAIVCIVHVSVVRSNSGSGSISKHKSSFFAFHSAGLPLLSVDSPIEFHSKKFGSINLNPKTHSHSPRKTHYYKLHYFQRLRGISSTSVITTHFGMSEMPVSFFRFRSFAFSLPAFSFPFALWWRKRRKLWKSRERKREWIKAYKMLSI